MNLDLYTINDIIRFEFFKLPKALFTNPKYKNMSSDAKLTYSLLYDRLSLSKQNGWINERDEVFLIYTRNEVADMLGVTYKKAMAAFRELITNGLIFEKRCGRGLANKIYIVKPEIVREDAMPRTADTEVLEDMETAEKSSNIKVSKDLELPKEQLLNFQIGGSETPVSEYQELPNRVSNQNDFKKNYIIHTDHSQSVYSKKNDDEELQGILENCHLEYFDKGTQLIFRDAIERLWYCERFKIGNAILPQANVRSRMYKLDHSVLETALHNLHQNKEREIKNVTAYVMSTIFNCIAEEFSMLLVDPYLNRMRAGGG